MQQTELSTSKSGRFTGWSVPVALLVLTALTYGLMIPYLGLYQDDRYMTWFAKSFGSRVFIPFFAQERPALGILYMLTSSLVGWSAPAWHVFALLMRWLVSLVAWWCMLQVWPKKRAAAVWVALLLAVYPGFQQHFVAMGFSNFYVRLAALLFSFGLSASALRRNNLSLPLTVFAWLLAVVGYIPSEYLFAMEWIRPVLFWIVFQDLGFSKRDSLRRSLVAWLPFVLLQVGFIIWRIFFFKFPTYQPVLANSLSANPLLELLNLARTVLWDAVEAGFLAWDNTWHPFTLGEKMGLSTWISLGLGILAALGVGLYCYWLRLENSEEKSSWPGAAIALGALSMLWVGAPFWFAGLQVELQIPYDRVTLPFMFSACLLWVGLIDWLAGSRLKKILLVSIAVGLAVGAQFRLANSFRLAFETQKNIFTQLIWRVPDLQPGTLVLSNEVSSGMDGDNSFAATLNWIYDNQPTYPEMKYLWLFIPQRLGTVVPSLEPGVPVDKVFRSLTFRGTTDQTLVFDYSPPNCLRLLDVQTDGQFPGYPPSIAEAVKLSDPGIVTVQQDPAVIRGYEQLFGSLPEPDWCYYFEKAELARSQGENWEEVVRLGDLALALPQAQQNPIEFLPYIEGYAHQGNFEKSLKLSRQLFRSLPKTQGMICAVWQRIAADTDLNPEKSAALTKIQDDLSCQAATTGQPPP
jgi:hypothetical protein